MPIEWIRRGLGAVALLMSAWLALAAPATADEVPEVAPSADAPEGMLSWKTKDGLGYYFRMPLERDTQVPPCLTVLLHGSNLTRGWGFANHSWKSFRPYDLVVSPDGTSANGNGGFNFAGAGKDVKRFRALLAELRAAFPVDQVFLYGHSQGSFFALHYAGLEPRDIDGVVAHASGVWSNTKQHARARHQAIVLMHGTQDPVVPYDQSAGALAVYRKAKYPLVRLRSLEGWNHWPAEHNGPVPHTSQQLAWCEGMTTENHERLRVCLDQLRDVKSKPSHDYAATYQVARRILAMPLAPGELRAVAKGTSEAIAALSALHAERALQGSRDLGEAPATWTRHLQLFLASFEGTPGYVKTHAAYAEELEKQRDAALKHLRKHWQAKSRGKVKQAFEAGIKAMRAGPLTHWCASKRFRDTMQGYFDNAMAHKLPGKLVKAYTGARDRYESAFKAGWPSFKAVNEKVGAL